MDASDTGNERLIGLGVYTVSEAARLSGVSTGRIRRWLRGYQYKVREEQRISEPVWKPQIPIIDGVLALSFLDLMEVRFIDAFLNYGVSWRTIRIAEEFAADSLQHHHPFSTKAFKTDGRTIFTEFLHKTGETQLLDIVKSQFAFNQVIAPSLYAGLDFSSTDQAVRWWPLGHRRQVVIDPQRSFGQPIVSDEGVPTAVLANAVRVEKSVQRVAAWFSVTPRAVRYAVTFEEKLAA